MDSKSPYMPAELWSYVVDHWIREPDVLRQLREETAQLPSSGLQISPDQGQLLTMLIRLSSARRVLEIGVYTGYSSISMALGMPKDGELVACDVSDEYTSVARRYWKQAGVDSMVTLHIAPAVETLQRLLDEGQAGSFDAVFIDADKPSYPAYYEMSLQLLKTGGMILVDNVFWSGKVADPAVADEGTQQMRDFNALLAKDERIDIAIIPMADGLTVARKR